MSTITQLYVDEGLTEDEVCATLGITHLRFRQELHRLDLAFPTTYSKGLEAELNLALAEGKTYAQIDRMYHGLDYNHIYYNYARRVPFKDKSSKKPLIEEEIRSDSKLTTTEIAQKFGVAPSYVSQLKRQVSGVKSKEKRRALTDKEWEVVKQLLDKGETISFVCRQFNLSRSTVYYRLGK